MLLNLNDTQSIKNPSADNLRNEIPNIGVGEFCVLSDGNEAYIQFYRNDEETYQLEFRAGSADHHYLETTNQLSVEAIVATFVGYLAGDPDLWWKPHDWKKVELGEEFEEVEFLTHYTINGKEYSRVRIGKERKSSGKKGSQCPSCEAASGEYHEEQCEMEECPCCRKKILNCDCYFE